MKQKKLIIGLVLVAVVSLVGCNQQAELKQGMADLDTAYIPALALTSQAQAQPSQKAITRLVRDWEQFKSDYYQTLSQQNQNKLDKIEAHILEAEQIIKSGENLVEAHEVLEEIRMLALEVRTDKEIDYYIDYLTRFHTPMEEIVLAAQNKDVAKIKEHLPQVINTWQQVKKKQIPAELFDMDDKQVDTLKQIIEAETKSLTDLQKVVESGNRQQIIQTAVKIKPNFAKLFIAFGNFKGLK